MGQKLVGALGADHQRIGDKAPFLKLLDDLVLGGGWRLRIAVCVLGNAPGIGKKIEIAAGGDLGVFLAERAGSGVARIDVVLPAIFGRMVLKPLELGMG